MIRFGKTLMGIWVVVAGLTSGSALASGGGSVPLDRAPVDVRNPESLQSGAQVFVNYCLSCHSAQAMRYNRLTDLGLTLPQIKDNLVLTEDKVGDTMKIAMRTADAKVWMGAAPPDLSVIARARGADWLYTYMRAFYRDPSRPTGWNNVVFDKVGMPHVLWQMQGDLEHQVLEGKQERAANAVRSWTESALEKDGSHKYRTHQLVLTKAGELTRLDNGKANTVAYDQKVGDLVNYLVWMGEPAQVTRQWIGYGVLLFLLFILVPLTYFLKKEYWRDIH